MGAFRSKPKKEQRCEWTKEHFQTGALFRLFAKHLLHRSDWTEPTSFCRFKSAVLPNPTFWLTPLYNATILVSCLSRKANRLLQNRLATPTVLDSTNFQGQKIPPRQSSFRIKHWQKTSFWGRARSCQFFQSQEWPPKNEGSQNHFKVTQLVVMLYRLIGFNWHFLLSPPTGTFFSGRKRAGLQVTKHRALSAPHVYLGHYDSPSAGNVIFGASFPFSVARSPSFG